MTRVVAEVARVCRVGDCERGQPPGAATVKPYIAGGWRVPAPMGRPGLSVALIALAAARARAAPRPYADPTPAEGGRVVRASVNVSVSRVAPDCHRKTRVER